ncbi:MAG: hypothetical protein JNK66_03180 [Chitinophagales bacterium]|nr:hypothetical protein [Chitinophagales bacterium]
MNQLFSFSRWWLLVRKTYFEKKRLYLLSALTILALGLAFYIVFLILNSTGYFGAELQAGFYFGGLFITGCLFASVQFSDLADKSKGIAFITLPASQLEKLLAGVFFSVLVFTVVYTALFYSVNTPALKISNSIRYNVFITEQEYKRVNYPETYDSTERFKPAELVNVFKYKNDSSYYSDNDSDEEQDVQNIYGYIWMAFLAVQAFYALGSIYFGAYSFVKTSVSILGLAVVFFFFGQIITSFFPSSYESLNYDLYSLADNTNIDSTTYYNLPDWLLVFDTWLLQYLFFPLFWFIAYIRLKEKQI